MHRLVLVFLTVILTVVLTSGTASAQERVVKPSIEGGYCTQAFAQKYGNKIGIRVKSINENNRVEGFIGGRNRSGRGWRQNFGERATATFQNGTLRVTLANGDSYSLQSGSAGKLVGDYSSPKYGNISGVVFSSADKSCY